MYPSQRTQSHNGLQQAQWKSDPSKWLHSIPKIINKNGFMTFKKKDFDLKFVSACIFMNMMSCFLQYAHV